MVSYLHCIQISFICQDNFLKIFSVFFAIFCGFSNCAVFHFNRSVSNILFCFLCHYRKRTLPSSKSLRPFSANSKNSVPSPLISKIADSFTRRKPPQGAFFCINRQNLRRLKLCCSQNSSRKVNLRMEISADAVGQKSRANHSPFRDKAITIKALTQSNNATNSAPPCQTES